MQESINLSIVIACHSKTPYFSEMLDSFLSSGYHFNNCEILICDDASPSGGDGETARIYSSKYPKLIKCIRNEQNLGVSRSYQKLVSMAQGRYIMPFDSDDIFVPFDIDDAIKELDEHPEWCANYGKKMLFSAQDGYLNSSHGGDYSTFALLLDPRMTHIGMIIRKDDLQKSRGYFLPDGTVCKVADDVCLWSALCAKKEMHFRNEVRGLYRIHSGQETKVKAQMYAQAYDTIRDAFLSEHNNLAAKITHNAPFQISEEERLAATVICGIKFIRANTREEKIAYLNIASQLMPFDYAIDEYRIKDAVAAGDYNTAFKYTSSMLANYSDKLYAFSVALEFAVQLNSDNKFLESRLKFRLNEILNQFFTVSDSTRQLLEKTVAAAKQR